MIKKIDNQIIGVSRNVFNLLFNFIISYNQTERNETPLTNKGRTNND
jgi:hypothetical protein